MKGAEDPPLETEEEGEEIENFNQACCMLELHNNSVDQIIFS